MGSTLVHQIDLNLGNSIGLGAIHGSHYETVSRGLGEWLGNKRHSEAPDMLEEFLLMSLFLLLHVLGHSLAILYNQCYRHYLDSSD